MVFSNYDDSTILDARSAPRLARLFLGCLLASERRTVTTWIRAADLNEEYRACYTTLAAACRKADSIASQLVHEVVQPLFKDAPKLLFAIDDTPTPRFGQHVQGAGVHHNPTPGPAGGAFLYGHVFVVLGLLVGHRSASPWDAGDRRPSHADKRRAWQRELLAEEITLRLQSQPNDAKMSDLAETILSLAL